MALFPLSRRPTPKEQVLGACQCSFCRKHNARALSDPKAHVTLTAADPQQLQTFGLRTSEQIICRRCGVYVAMTLADEDWVWSVISVDTLEDRGLFTRPPEARDYTVSQGERPAGARPRSSADLRSRRASLTPIALGQLTRPNISMSYQW